MSTDFDLRGAETVISYKPLSVADGQVKICGIYLPQAEGGQAAPLQPDRGQQQPRGGGGGSPVPGDGHGGGCVQIPAAAIRCLQQIQPRFVILILYKQFKQIVQLIGTNEIFALELQTINRRSCTVTEKALLKNWVADTNVRPL